MLMVKTVLLLAQIIESIALYNTQASGCYFGYSSQLHTTVYS